MGKKKPKQKLPFQTEEEFFCHLKNILIPTWKNNKTDFKNSTNNGYLSSVKTDFRSQRVCELIFLNPDIFDIEIEFKNIPQEHISEDILMEIASNYISEDKLSIPVLVAYELKKRQVDLHMYRNRDSYGYNYQNQLLTYPKKASRYLNSIRSLANEIESFSENGCAIEENSFEDLIYLIKSCTEGKEFEPDEEYKTLYRKIEYTGQKKLIILVQGITDSGKIRLSNSIKGIIKDAKYYDSDIYGQHTSLEEIISYAEHVSIFSDPYIFSTINDAKNIYPNANIFKVYVKPEDIKTMIYTSKRRSGVSKDYLAKVKDENKYSEDRNINLADLVVTNDFTESGMIKISNEVIYEIIKKYGDFKRCETPRPTSNDLVEKLGEKRIIDGTERIERTLIGVENEYDFE